MVRTKDSFKHRYVDYEDGNCCCCCCCLLILCWSTIELISDGLNIDDDTNEGLILGITECADDDNDKGEDGFDNGQEYNNE